MAENHEIGYIASRRFPGEFIQVPLANETMGERGKYTYCSEGQAKFQSIYTWMLIRVVFKGQCHLVLSLNTRKKSNKSAGLR